MEEGGLKKNHVKIFHLLREWQILDAIYFKILFAIHLLLLDKDVSIQIDAAVK